MLMMLRLYVSGRCDDCAAPALQTLMSVQEVCEADEDGMSDLQDTHNEQD